MEDAETVERDQRIIPFREFLRISTWDYETGQAKLGRRYAFYDDFPQGKEYGKLHYAKYIVDVAPTVHSKFSEEEVIKHDLFLLEDAWKLYQRHIGQ